MLPFTPIGIERFQVYKKTKDGLIHITSILANSIEEAAEINKEGSLSPAHQFIISLDKTLDTNGPL